VNGTGVERQKTRIDPQSGHSHVTLLQVSPHAFSSMHDWHSMNPQVQLQQTGTFSPQIVHVLRFGSLRFLSLDFPEGLIARWYTPITVARNFRFCPANG
jgi:hypothetical protein